MWRENGSFIHQYILFVVSSCEGMILPSKFPIIFSEYDIVWWRGRKAEYLGFYETIHKRWARIPRNTMQTRIAKCKHNSFLGGIKLVQHGPNLAKCHVTLSRTKKLVCTTIRQQKVSQKVQPAGWHETKSKGNWLFCWWAQNPNSIKTNIYTHTHIHVVSFCPLRIGLWDPFQMA